MAIFGVGCNRHFCVDGAVAGALAFVVLGKLTQTLGPALPFIAKLPTGLQTAVLFSLLVIGVSFLPILALEAQEGRLFKPLAYTKTLAMFVAAILAITLDPALRMLLTRPAPYAFRPVWLRRTANTLLVGTVRQEDSHPVSRVLMRLYAPVAAWTLRCKWFVISAALLLVIVTVPAFLRLGSEFMPPLDEGTLLYMPTTIPGASLSAVRAAMEHQDSVLMTFPEVKGVQGMISRGKTPEALEKGLLRSAHDLTVFKDGTTRFDMTNLVLTHFRPSEIGLPVERARDLGYTRDLHGAPLERDTRPRYTRPRAQEGATNAHPAPPHARTSFPLREDRVRHPQERDPQPRRVGGLPQRKRGGAARLEPGRDRHPGAEVLPQGRHPRAPAARNEVARGGESGMSAAPILSIENVTLDFDGFLALRNLNFAMQPGELRFVIGPNGAGKTSLLDVITGKVRPTRGRVTFDGHDLAGRAPQDVAALRAYADAIQWPAILKPDQGGSGARIHVVESLAHVERWPRLIRSKAAIVV